MTNAIMIILLFILIFIVTYDLKCEKDRKIFSIEDTTAIKGIFCIIVVLVHIPTLYQNKIQDMIGSFAYIGVTIFFMTSSYGLKYGIHHKKDYLKNFWFTRLPKLLIPQFFVNLLNMFIKIINHESYKSVLLSIFGISDWVKLLLLFYILFYVVNIIVKNSKWKDFLLITFVIFYSLLGKMFPNISMHWEVESLGFAYGILLYNFLSIYNKWINHQYFSKCVFFCFSSLILGLLYLKVKPVFFVGDYFVKIILGIFLLLFLLQIMGRYKIGNKVSLFLGSISYESYLIHHVVFKYLEFLGDRFHFHFNSGMFIILSLFIILCISFLIHKITNHLLTILKRFEFKCEKLAKAE